MIAAVIAIACFAFYATGILLTARVQYRRLRPYTEPLACETPAGHRRSGHQDWCYRRSGMIDTNGEAVVFALLWGLVWPFIAPAMGVRRIVVGGDRPLPAETTAKIERLEAENERLKREQEGRA